MVNGDNLYLVEFTVKVLTEDEQPMASTKVSSLSLKLWKMDANVSSGPPSRVTSSFVAFYPHLTNT